MIHLIERARSIGVNHKCRECLAAAGYVDKMICDSCRNNVTTAYKCPRCNRISYYTGIDEPIMCASCTAIFPAMEVVKLSLKARKKYHIDPELL